MCVGLIVGRQAKDSDDPARMEYNTEEEILWCNNHVLLSPATDQVHNWQHKPAKNNRSLTKQCIESWLHDHTMDADQQKISFLKKEVQGV